MGDIFGLVIVRPFGIVLMAIFNAVHSYGLAVMLFALLIKLILIPLGVKSKKNMMSMTAMNAEMQAIQKKYANNRVKMNEEVQKLYDKHGVNPMTGCLPQFIQLPIMMGLYYVVAQPLRYFMGLSTEEIAKMAELLNIEGQSTIQMQAQVVAQYFDNFNLLSQHFDGLMKVDFNFLGINLALTPSFKEFNILWVVPILSGATAFLQSYVMRLMQKRQGVVQDASANASAAMMNVMMPAMSIYFGFILPAGLGVYWISRNIFSVIQELILTPYFIKKGREKEAQMIAEQEEKKKLRQEEMAQRRMEQSQQAKSGKEKGKQSGKTKETKDSSQDDEQV